MNNQERITHLKAKDYQKYLEVKKKTFVEETLVKDGIFCLPSKRKLLGDSSLEAILVDATECEIERPQKNSADIIPARKRSTITALHRHYEQFRWLS